MKKIINNKKILYSVILAIIIIGIVVTCVFKLNYSLMYSEHTRLTIYLGKDYEIKDIEKIAKEVFPNQKTELQRVEIYNDTPVINVQNATEEQIEQLKTKIVEKYEVEETEGLISTKNIGHIQGRDLIKPYIKPILISLAIILVYVAIMYRKLGIVKVILNLIINIILSQGVLLSVIAITRFPIGIYTMPIAIIIYIIVISVTIYKYQNKLDKKELQEKKKK